MAQMNVLEALRAAMAWELEHDAEVVILGEDVGTAGGIFRTTQGLFDCCYPPALQKYFTLSNHYYQRFARFFRRHGFR